VQDLRRNDLHHDREADPFGELNRLVGARREAFLRDRQTVRVGDLFGFRALSDERFSALTRSSTSRTAARSTVSRSNSIRNDSYRTPAAWSSAAGGPSQPISLRISSLCSPSSGELVTSTGVSDKLSGQPTLKNVPRSGCDFDDHPARAQRFVFDQILGAHDRSARHVDAVELVEHFELGVVLRPALDDAEHLVEVLQPRFRRRIAGSSASSGRPISFASGAQTGGWMIT
jgi:hypothetical protein